MTYIKAINKDTLFMIRPCSECSSGSTMYTITLKPICDGVTFRWTSQNKNWVNVRPPSYSYIIYYVWHRNHENQQRRCESFIELYNYWVFTLIFFSMVTCPAWAGTFGRAYSSTAYTQSTVKQGHSSTAFTER